MNRTLSMSTIRKAKWTRTKEPTGQECRSDRQRLPFPGQNTSRYCRKVRSWFAFGVRAIVAGGGFSSAFQGSCKRDMSNLIGQVPTGYDF
ncbi:hypothetical protein BJX70DRAFT_374853 [Aspergillus crustosus]